MNHRVRSVSAGIWLRPTELKDGRDVPRQLGEAAGAETTPTGVPGMEEKGRG